MADEPRGAMPELAVDRANLFREETYTDLHVATIKRLVPVLADGTPDRGRPAVFVGQTQIMTQVGPVPVQSVIEAKSLSEAIDRFPEALAGAIDTLMHEVAEARRREASRIVHPSEVAPPSGGIIR